MIQFNGKDNLELEFRCRFSADSTRSLIIAARHLNLTIEQYLDFCVASVTETVNRHLRDCNGKEVDFDAL